MGKLKGTFVSVVWNLRYKCAWGENQNLKTETFYATE